MRPVTTQCALAALQEQAITATPYLPYTSSFITIAKPERQTDADGVHSFSRLEFTVLSFIYLFFYFFIVECHRRHHYTPPQHTLATERNRVEENGSYITGMNSHQFEQSHDIQ